MFNVIIYKMTILNNTIETQINDNIKVFFNLLFYFATTRLAIYFFNQNPNYIVKVKCTWCEIVEFYKFISIHNPLFVGYFDDIHEVTNNKEDTTEYKTYENKKDEDKPKENYEDKYLTKFKSFPNDFSFTDEEFRLENEKYDTLKREFDFNEGIKKKEIEKKIVEINRIYTKGGITTDKGLNALLQFYTLEDEYHDDPESVDLDAYLEDLKVELNIYENNLKELETQRLSDDEFKKQASEYVLKMKLDNFIHNYITETTPLGAVHMRYNNVKQTFEYFSNNAIPYRYLETVGRKYVTTYWCKPIFVDIADELHKSEIKFDDDLKQKQINEEKRKSDPIETKKNIVANFKNYNKDTNKVPNNMRNGRQLPPQIMNTLQNVHKMSDKQFLKDRSNRYTCEGRFNDCPLLQKIDKNVSDKNYSMSFADFKRMKTNNQKKK